MNITIINGTNRHGNKSMIISEKLIELAQEKKHNVSLMDLSHWTELFRGDYIQPEDADKQQAEDIKKMKQAGVLMFVVPTYHSGMPSSLKNFFDTLKVPEAYADKIIGVISSNSSGRNYGAKQAKEVINGMLSYNKLVSSVVPIVPIINYNDIDEGRLERYIDYVEKFL